MTQIHIDDAHEGGIDKSLALSEFVGIEALVVVVEHEAQHGVLHVAGLHQHQAAFVGAPGTARHLLEHVEGTLRGAKVGKMQHRVGIEDAHHTHCLKVETLRHHLRAHEHIGAVMRKVVDDAVVTRLGASGVQIHARDFLAREIAVHLVLDALGTIAHHLDVRRFASRAQLRQRDGVAAIVAGEHVGVLVIGERHVAVLALGHPAALAAAHHRGITTAILEQDDLLVILQRMAAVTEQLTREHAVHLALSPGLGSIDEFHLGHGDVAIAGEQFHQPILSGHGAVIDLDGWRGTPQQRLGAVHLRQHDGGIATIVARSRVLLLVTAVVLLVDDDKAQLGKRQEHRTAHAHHHTRLAAAQQAAIDVHALVVAKSRVIDEHLVAKHRAQALRELRGERNFGHQIEHLQPARQGVRYQVHIDGGLAARGDAVQQGDVVVLERQVNLAMGTLLLLAEGGRVLQLLAQMGETIDLPLIHLHDATVGHRLEHLGGHVGTLEQSLLAHFLQRSAALQPVRQVQIGQQQLFLLARTAQRVEQRVHASLVVARQREAHKTFGLGTIVVHHALAHQQGATVKQTTHDALHTAKAGGGGQFGNLHATALRGEIQHHALTVTQLMRHVLLILGIGADKRLALHLEAAGQRRFIDLAHGAHVVTGYPLPELELRMPHDGRAVEGGNHIFHVVALRSAVVNHHHDGRINLLATQWHQHAATHPHSNRGGQMISKRTR